MGGWTWSRRVVFFRRVRAQGLLFVCVDTLVSERRRFSEQTRRIRGATVEQGASFFPPDDGDSDRRAY